MMNWSSRDVLVAAACATAVLVFLSPGIAFGAAGSIVRYPPYLYLSTAFTSALWALYARDWGLLPLQWLSMFGAVVETSYVLLFFGRSDAADPRRAHLLRYACYGAPLFLGVISFGLIIPKSSIYGVACCIASCAASAAPLYNVRRAFRERSVACMPSVYIPRCTIPNALLWIIINTTTGGVWNWKEVDTNLLVASLVAGLCALGQLLLHVRIGRLQRLNVPNVNQLVLQMHNLNLDEPENDDDDDDAAEEDAPLLH